jgi:bifunctional DNA-binding transcriptional regulator/antitoxin component of YhaV-PrlF toxin-antitoxin module
MGYSFEEQETALVFDNSTKKWMVYSTVPKHIRKLSKLTELNILEYENEKPIAIKCELSEKMVSMKKEIVLTEEQKQKRADALSKARNAVNLGKN